MQEFKFGHTSTNDKQRSGSPSDATNNNPGMIKKILPLVTDEHCKKRLKITILIIVHTGNSD